MSDRPRFTLLGKAISFLLVLGLVALGAFMVMRGKPAGGPADKTDAGETEEPAIFPSFSSDQLSSSLTVSFTLNPWVLKNTEFSFGSMPPLAAISPAYPAYSLISIGTMLSL